MHRPQVALDLHYLITACGDEGHLYPQRLLGSAVRVLHSRPVLTREAIHKMVEDPPEGTDLGASDLAEQTELVKLTPVPMGLEELHNLWFGFFQAPYLLSVVYQASVVLNLTQGGDIPHLDGGSFAVSPHAGAEAVGLQVAQTLYGGLQP